MLDILLIDDDELLRQTMSMLLAREGFAVKPAGGGREALELARRQLFDLVICDVRMGDMDGLQTVEALRSVLPDAHIILITGYADEEAPIQALRLRVDDYLRKPFDLDAFLARIRQLRRARRKPPGREVLLSFTEELRRRAEWASHVAAVEQAAVGAAERLGLPPEEVQALRLAARLHDLVSGAPAAEDEDEPLELVARLLVSLGGASQWKAQQILNASVALAHGQEPLGVESAVVEEVRRFSGHAVADERLVDPLRLVTLGDIRIQVSGRVPVWESARARWLFLYLVSRRGQSVSQERLRDMFWPNSDEDKGQRALVSTVHRIRKALELPEAVLRDERSYRFNPGLPCWWDVDHLERFAREGRAAEKAGRIEDAVRAYAQAAALYRGDFARECADEWVAPVRESCLRVAMECLERLAELQDPPEAERAARRALELEPTSEPAAASLLRALAGQNRRDEAVRFYHAFGKVLQRELDLPPGPELTRAYLESVTKS